MALSIDEKAISLISTTMKKGITGKHPRLIAALKAALEEKDSRSPELYAKALLCTALCCLFHPSFGQPLTYMNTVLNTPSLRVHIPCIPKVISLIYILVCVKSSYIYIYIYIYICIYIYVSVSVSVCVLPFCLPRIYTGALRSRFLSRYAGRCPLVPV